MDRPLYPDDIVAKKSNESLLAVVDRTHGDVDTHEPRPGQGEESINRDKDIKKSAFTKFMKDGIPPKGTALVRWADTAGAQLIPESKLKLLDRSLLIGDVVKKSAHQAMSGVVINTFTKCSLQPMCDLTLNNDTVHLKGLLPPTGSRLAIRQPASGQPTPLVDIPASELQYAESPTEEDLVIYKDWIGRVDAVTGAITLRLSDSCVVEIEDDLAEHTDGALDAFYVGDIASTKKGRLRSGRWIFGQYDANTLAIGTVVDTRKVALEVTWLQRRIGSSESEREPPSPLERDEMESADFHVYDRTLRPPNTSTTQSNQTVSNSEIDVRLGLRVRFKDLSGACVKYDGSTPHGKLSRMDRKDTLGYDLNVFDVTKIQTDVTVQWQDLSVTQGASVELVPDASIDDEHAAWPGEIAHTLDLEPVPGMPGVTQPGKVGVIQSVNASERMAKIQWHLDACLQYSNDESGDHENKSLLTGVVGDTVSDEEEVSLYDMEAPGEINVRRGDVVLIANQRWKPPSLVGAGNGLDWVGEIVDTCLAGNVVVRLGAAPEIQDVFLRREDFRVAVRSDGTDTVDGWGDEESPTMVIDSDGELMIAERSSGESDLDDSDTDTDGYTDSEEEEDEPVATYEDENGEPLDEDDVQDEDWESEQDDDVKMPDAPHETPPTSQSATPTDTAKRKAEATLSDRTTDIPSEVPQSYLILEGSVPSSHHFAVEPSTDTATHLKRSLKEHKILRSANALPNGVYVRTWESRLDIIRVLFVGPAETPYADAPFMIDFYLPPSFPSEPPQAYFHSWTAESGLGGVGRVNPNLYEDGKICLSLLGTWEGNKGEGWNAGRSTLLQVIVSLLGLVLVREPFFNEAGYEPLAGLESSKRPSALYNERTFLKSRTFVISALKKLYSEHDNSSMGIEGVEDVLKWLYKASNGPKLLESTIANVEAVLRRSEQGGEEPDGLMVMSKGACIPLRRVVDRLKEL